MIAKGNPHNSGPYLARYLAASSKGNESAELAELRGFASDNIFDAFALAQLQAEGTHCQKPLFHVQVRNPKGEELTREQWARVADRIEKQLGFSGQPRAVVFHDKDGGRHMHLVWSRIDGETMRALDPGLYKRKLKEICRKLEKEMGLQQVRNERAPDEKTQPPARPEFEQGRRLKTDLKAIREGIRDCWDRSANGAGFVAALEREGLILAKGDKRSFVVVDEMGGYHALGKRITGATAEQTRARLADLKAASLPPVEAAQAMQRERREQEKGAMADQQEMTDEDRRREEAEKAEAARLEAIQKDEEQRQEAIKEEEERRQQAIAEEEERRQEGIREEEKKREAFKEQAERQVEQAREMEAQEERLAAYREEMGRRAEEAKREEERNREAQAEGRAREGEIRNPHSRYGQALAQHYDVKDPYGSLARSAMAEYGSFLRDRENLDKQIAKAEDPKERETLELRKRIEAADYMAITSERIAQQSYIIQGKPIIQDKDRDPSKSLDEQLAERPDVNKEYHRQKERAAEFRKEAQELRAQYRDLQAERFRDREDDTRAPGAARREPEPEAARETARRPEPVQDKEPGAGAPVKAEKAAQEREQRQDEPREPFPEIDYGKDVREAWRQSKDGPEFSDRLKEKGYVLARDGEGAYDHTVQEGKTKIAAVAVNGYAYRLDPERVGAEQKDFASRIRETKPAELPSLDEARARQKDIREHKQPERQAEKQSEQQPAKAAPSIMVQERQPGKPRGEPQGVTDFVKGLPEMKEPPQLPKSPAALRNNPAAKRAHYEQLIAEQQRGPAIDRIGEDLKAGRPLDAADVRKLNKADREGIKERGEEHLKELVQQRGQERTHERER